MSTNSSPPELKWNRFDALVALAVVLLAVVSALCFYLPKNQSGALTVVIDISGQEVRRVPLSDFTEATVTSRGYTLHIAAEGGAVSVTDSDCPTQDCVHTGAISRAGQSIVCLPAQVVVHLEGSWGEHMKWTAKNIALCAVLAALALGLSTLEGLFPISLLVPLPGVKLGLANIVTVFALYQLGAGAALAILLTRCLLGGLFAGNLSAMLFSVLGGLTAMLVMIFLRRLPKLSVYGVSIGGAAAHNIGQMAAAVITLGSTMVLGYLPFLLAVSLFTGALTGFITALLLRATRHIRFH